MLNAMEANEAMRDLNKSDARQQMETSDYLTQQGRIASKFSEYLADAYLPGFPQSAANEVFGKAWADGHAHGFSEIESEYAGLADLIVSVSKHTA